MSSKKKILPLHHIKHEKLKHVPFDHEEDFSQALVDDFLDVISEIIGYDIDPETVKTEEKAGGDFVADIIAEITGSDVEDGTRKKIIIENQLDYSDHKHLGQCVTYAANKDARIIIWICETFKEPHIDALRWLNEKFSGQIGFYGLEVTAYKGEYFDDGNPRLDFNVIEAPHLEKITLDDPKKKKRFEIFTKTQERFNEISPIKTTKKCQPHWEGHHLRPKLDLVDLYWQHFKPTSNHGERMACNMKCRTGTRGGKKTIDDEKTWQILQQNKKMIDERLPGIEWRPAGKHQDKYSLRISVDAHEGVENINAERLTEIAEKLASDMKIFVEIGKELKL